MSKILSVKKWTRVEYDAGDGYVIGMDLKRLRYDQSNRLLVANTQAFGALNSAASPEKKEGEADQPQSMAEKLEQISGQAQAAQRFYEALKPEMMDWVWKDCVRKVTGLEADGVAVTTGEGLAELADAKLVIWILIALQSNAALTSTEGKASSSPSTSGSEGPTLSDGDGASLAQSTGSDSGEGSTATPIHN